MLFSVGSSPTVSTRLIGEEHQLRLLSAGMAGFEPLGERYLTTNEKEVTQWPR